MRPYDNPLSKIGGGEIDNQWFKGAKMTIVPRPMQESRKRVARSMLRDGQGECLRMAKKMRGRGGGIVHIHSRNARFCCDK